jgi:hypothetical protein
MKLWYQSLARETETTPYGPILKRVIEQCGPGHRGASAGHSEAAGIGMHYRILEHHGTREVVYNAMRARREGFNAFLIGNAGDSRSTVRRSSTASSSW